LTEQSEKDEFFGEDDKTVHKNEIPETPNIGSRRAKNSKPVQLN